MEFNEFAFELEIFSFEFDKFFDFQTLLNSKAKKFETFEEYRLLDSFLTSNRVGI